MESIADMAKNIAKKVAEEARLKKEAELRERQAADAALARMNEQITQALREAATLPGFCVEGNTLIYKGQRIAEAKVSGRMLAEEWTDSLHPPEEWCSVYELWTPGCTQPRCGFEGGRPIEVPSYRHLDSFRRALANHVSNYVNGG